MIGWRSPRFFLLTCVTLVWLGCGGELLCRFEGGYRLDRLELTRRPAVPSVAESPLKQQEAERGLLAQITYQNGVDPDWFFLPPVRVEKQANPELQKRTAANPAMQEQENYIWNEAVLQHPDEHIRDLLRTLKVDTIFAFPSYDGSPHPLYRLYPDNDYRPTPWVTNNDGWLSVDATARKPAGVVRVGIIGDSTSHNMYGLQLQTYLDTWAHAHGYPISFQVLNTARQGLGMQDELNALQYELGPMGIDYVCEYFAPRFALVPPQMAAFASLPAGMTAGSKPSQKHKFLEFVQRVLTPWSSTSALMHTLLEHITYQAPDSVLREPAKPRTVLHLPRGTDRDPVALRLARNDPYFAALASDLDRFRSIALGMHATPLVSTERLCVWDGMALNNATNRLLFDSLNGPSFWPFTYAELRQMLAAHNGTITAWAHENGVTVIDIDGRMPVRPELCSDAFHDESIAQRMRAWLIFQALVPLLEHDLADHSVPRNNADPSGHNPYLDRPILRLSRTELLSQQDTATR
jgi:hypothetical protein